MEIQNKKLDEGVFMQERQEVLGQWPTGKDVDLQEAADYQKRLSPERLKAYSKTDSPEYLRMVEAIQKRFGLSSLRFTRLEDLVEAIGLPKCELCTHCFDGSSDFSLRETNI